MLGKPIAFLEKLFRFPQRQFRRWHEFPLPISVIKTTVIAGNVTLLDSGYEGATD